MMKILSALLVASVVAASVWAATQASAHRRHGYTRVPLVHLLPAGAGRAATRSGALRPGDVDTFAVWAPAGSLLAIAVRTEDDGELDDPILGIRGPRDDVFRVLSDDGGPGFLPRASVPVERSGIWRVAVSGFGDDAFEGAHEERLWYQVEFALIPRPGRVWEGEPYNDTPGRAPILHARGPSRSTAIVTGRLTPGDTDYFRVPGARVVAASLYDGEGGEFNDSVLRLQVRGEERVRNDDGGPIFLSNLRTTTGGCAWSVVSVEGYDPDPSDETLHREDFVYHLVVTTKRGGGGPWWRRCRY